MQFAGGWVQVADCASAGREVVVVSVRDAVERDLERLPEDLAGSALAASALALAQEIDRSGNSATSKSMCAKALQDVLRELRSLAPAEEEHDEIDELEAQRRRRIAGSSIPQT